MVILNMGVSENSVPLNPMVNDQIIPIKWLFHWEYEPNIFRQTHVMGSINHEPTGV